jgi:hypothetical protein
MKMLRKLSFHSFFDVALGSVADPDSSDPYVLGLMDPDPLVRGTDPASDPDPDPSIIKQNSKKNLDSCCFVTSL